MKLVRLEAEEDIKAGRESLKDTVSCFVSSSDHQDGKPVESGATALFFGSWAGTISYFFISDKKKRLTYKKSIKLDHPILSMVYYQKEQQGKEKIHSLFVSLSNKEVYLVKIPQSKQISRFEKNKVFTADSPVIGMHLTKIRGALGLYTIEAKGFKVYTLSSSGADRKYSWSTPDGALIAAVDTQRTQDLKLIGITFALKDKGVFASLFNVEDPSKRVDMKISIARDIPRSMAVSSKFVITGYKNGGVIFTQIKGGESRGIELGKGPKQDAKPRSVGAICTWNTRGDERIFCGDGYGTIMEITNPQRPVFLYQFKGITKSYSGFHEKEAINPVSHVRMMGGKEWMEDYILAMVFGYDWEEGQKSHDPGDIIFAVGLRK
ncbi:hypothetical protein ADUPG1_010659 [Aduncisulcus paluster]|uniref:Uncharacterized protein n=1 Tax=Aduncisulcus paluster TaxID=2918883 RepID=A0ABQ5JSK4_9EUKA|nr:hypothetical protein ADUPG1_010659 [Aduncisulcus paluster]